jgi:hypothetical protein
MIILIESADISQVNPMDAMSLWKTPGVGVTGQVRAPKKITKMNVDKVDILNSVAVPNEDVDVPDGQVEGSGGEDKTTLKMISFLVRIFPL